MPGGAAGGAPAARLSFCARTRARAASADVGRPGAARRAACGAASCRFRNSASVPLDAGEFARFRADAETVQGQSGGQDRHEQFPCDWIASLSGAGVAGVCQFGGQLSQLVATVELWTSRYNFSDAKLAAQVFPARHETGSRHDPRRQCAAYPGGRRPSRHPRPAGGLPAQARDARQPGGERAGGPQAGRDPRHRPDGARHHDARRGWPVVVPVHPRDPRRPGDPADGARRRDRSHRRAGGRRRRLRGEALQSARIAGAHQERPAAGERLCRSSRARRTPSATRSRAGSSTWAGANCSPPDAARWP